jgi:hypothetical protein
MDRDKSSCNEALSVARNNPRFKSLGLNPNCTSSMGKIAEATCRILKLDDVIVTKLLHVVADVVLISPVSMAEER